jgi:type VI secretion system protein ImpF
MPRVSADQPLVPSVLDRLLDDDPTVTRETVKSRTQVLRELRQSLRRDLENLLNTRWRCTSWPEDLEELELSLVNYGIPDISGADLGSAQSREEFSQIVERVLECYEPRFKSVRVTMLPNSGLQDRTLRFRIEALLYAEPAPEPVSFDSTMEPLTGNVEVKGIGR